MNEQTLKINTRYISVRLGGAAVTTLILVAFYTAL